MNLIVTQMVTGRRNLKMTILYRPGGKWHRIETDKLVNGLLTEVSEDPKCPEYLLLSGHYTKAETLKAIGGGAAYVAIQITGLNDERLPFIPGFV